MSNSPTLTPDHRSDSDLAALAARRDPAGAIPAFRTLHQRYAPRLLAWLAARVDPDDLEAAGRTLWTRIWEALGDPDEFDGQDVATLIQQKADDYAKANGRAVDEARSKALAMGLAALHAGERVVVEFKLGGLTFEEIGTRAKSTAERAEKVFETARKKLEASLESHAP